MNARMSDFGVESLTDPAKGHALRRLVHIGGISEENAAQLAELRGLSGPIYFDALAATRVLDIVSSITKLRARCRSRPLAILSGFGANVAPDSPPTPTRARIGRRRKKTPTRSDQVRRRTPHA